jgi:cysteine-rich secretory family protein
VKHFLIFCLLLVTPLLAAAQRASDFDYRQESEIIDLINKERSDRGLPPVRIDLLLTNAARLHTQLMIEKHELSHRLSEEPVLRDRIANTGLAFSVAGENVAYDANAQDAHIAFMHSPGHKANILNPDFDHVGVGIMHQGNLIWVTEDFAKRLGTTSASEAASIITDKYSELRRKAGSPPAAEHVVPALGKMACQMAHNDHIDTVAARKLPNVRGVLAWTATDPAKLPTQVKQLADDRVATNYSLGACFASSASYPNKVFWLVLAVY